MRGRPRKSENLDLVSLDEACARIKRSWRGELTYARKTLQNKIYLLELRNHGTRRKTLVDWNEIVRLKLSGPYDHKEQQAG
jgi:hypothetical protein